MKKWVRVRRATRVHSRAKGFTLIEIMVVVVILGILAALVVPNILQRPDEARVTAARADIRAIANALEMYRLDNHTYPSTDQGLDALVRRPSGFPEARNWNSEGYLKNIPRDPWGNDYQYISPGTRATYDLYSFGADGREGGEGVNAVIGNWDL
ncbi:type II secretion system major pseudopilin GspG [Desulfurispirillum indicum]|uniref:type II secretion system major pseudopilin GspG n=1 Tax=Desulfurispirillum indicum TaxID=936456 RepID=UPI001CFB620F|nr:type II secretion system major pseudopilin GspG [Desulfurispirillum indicum]UCZ56748.1 type II secretion system major pseudopilin GspG [Desulfurispirillum indicum]